MSAPEPHIDFKDLRRAAIDYAQAASGQIWTDYNLHDPGVTLLEQTCFALSNLAYQASFPPRDLLTTPRGFFAPSTEKTLYRPVKSLRASPVTGHDLNAYLSEQKGIARAWAEPTNPDNPGHYDVVAVPAMSDASNQTIIATIHAAFDRIRPLCTQIAQVKVANVQRMVLKGEIEITEAAQPERVAAELYHAVNIILQGLPYQREALKGARRADIYDDPVALLHRPGVNRARTPDLDAHLNRLRAIPGLGDIGALSLEPFETGPFSDPSYYKAVLPRSDDQIGINLKLNGSTLVLNAATIREEHTRIAAEQIGANQHHVDRSDLAVLKPGRHRDVSVGNVDSHLPALYAVHGYTPKSGDSDMVRYRRATNKQLRDMGAAIDQLYDTFRAETDVGLADPVAHRQRVAFLDYRIALFGDTLPRISHTGLNFYRSTVEKQAFALSWRLDYLYALAALNADRGVGPAGHQGGFLTKLSVLTDLDMGGGGYGDLSSKWGLSVVPDATLNEGTDYAFSLTVPDDPFEMIVPVDPLAQVYNKTALLHRSPWLDEGQITPKMLQCVAEPDAFLLAQNGSVTWHVLLDHDPGNPPVLCYSAPDQKTAKRELHRLRATWRRVHEAAEGAYLLEDIMLGDGFAPNEADLVVTGWTARTAQQSYRNHVQDMVSRLSPAHVLVRVHWLDLEQME
ncbi:MAG: hypothetical protein OXD48_12400, partial [Litoreibacter sp.]|nr:hypothetical protein [Litoreibacter sp.]